MDEAVKKARVDINSKGQMRLDKNRNKQDERIDPLAAAMCSHKLAMNHDFEDLAEGYTDEFFENLWGSY